MSFEPALERIQAVCFTNCCRGKLFHMTGPVSQGHREGSVAEFRSCPWNRIDSTGRRVEWSP